jgi:hypothetical protein
LKVTKKSEADQLESMLKKLRGMVNSHEVKGKWIKSREKGVDPRKDPKSKKNRKMRAARKMNYIRKIKQEKLKI